MLRGGVPADVFKDVDRRVAPILILIVHEGEEGDRDRMVAPDAPCVGRHLGNRRAVIAGVGWKRHGSACLAYYGSAGPGGGAPGPGTAGEPVPGLDALVTSGPI